MRSSASCTHGTALSRQACTATAGLCAIVIAGDLPTVLLYVLATVMAVAGAPVRPAAATLMPGLARSPTELVAANMACAVSQPVAAARARYSSAIRSVTAHAAGPATAARKVGASTL
jgi:hypothetical protein